MPNAWDDVTKSCAVGVGAYGSGPEPFGVLNCEWAIVALLDEVDGPGRDEASCFAGSARSA